MYEDKDTRYDHCSKKKMKNTFKATTPKNIHRRYTVQTDLYSGVSGIHQSEEKK